MSTTLEVILKTAGFNEGATAIKKVGDEAVNTNNKLKTTTSTVDQVSKSTTSLGSKLANAGKQFSGTITNVAALGSTIVNLSRQYQDLSDTQIRVDRTQLKVSKTAEAVRAAQDKLNKLTSTGVKSGAAYEKALLDVKQAQEANTLAVTMNGEALEDQQRAYENFAMTLAPTILTAGSSITSMLKEMGGTKGIGGVTSKLSSFTSGLGISKTALIGMAGALSIAAAGIADIMDLLKKADEFKKAQAHIATGKATVDELQSQVTRANSLMDRVDVRLWDFMKGGPIGKALFGPTTKEVGTELVKSLESEIDRKGAIKAWQDILVRILSDPQISNATKESIRKQITYIETVIGNESNWKAGYGTTAEAVKANTLKILGLAMDKTATDVKAGTLESSFRAIALATGEGLTGAMRDQWLKVNKGGEFNLTAPMTGLFAANPTAISAGPDTIGAAMKKALTPTKLLSSEIAILTQESLKNASTSDIQKAATNALSKAEAGLTQHTNDVAAAKIAAAKAARDLATAGDNELAGINKIIAAYNELEPKVTQKGKGHVTTAVQKLPIQRAQDALKTFMQGLAPTLTTGGAEKFATTWIQTAAKKIGAGASMILKPLLDYITQHKNDAPDVFASGLVDVIGSLNLEKNMQKAFLPATTASAAAAKSATENLGKIKIPDPTITKLEAQATKLIGDMTKKPAVITVTSKTTEAIKLSKEAVSMINKMKATIKINLAWGPSNVNSISSQLQSVWGGGKQHGYQSTVHRPTAFIAGEGGRPEDVIVRPRGSVQRGGSGGGGGGFYGTVNVYVDGVLRPARYSMGARK